MCQPPESLNSQSASGEYPDMCTRPSWVRHCPASLLLDGMDVSDPKNINHAWPRSVAESDQPTHS
jgi:hypothetical protein